MKITKEEILHVAQLARLRLSDAEMDELNMEGVIGFANQLSELNLDEVEPTNHVSDVYNVLRADEVKPSFDRDDILKNAPSKERGCVLVPKVVD
ncbi:MAG: Asp-tRNA(Asn)/Glu-tRNA(Gln) amidotransferase subunit GatC [Ruminococcaceae bacterium]|nr:Asp-tRNA(Asn)/Glu-tRNA(Gln) amidotransferase subunit GatC [Oscillospiraceae bacterium]